MGIISPLIGCSLLFVRFVMGSVPPNMITTVFNTQYLKAGRNAKERCQAGGDPNPTYIWKKDGNLLTSDTLYIINRTTGEIEIKSVTVLNGEGTYQCFAQNSMGTALSGFWEVRVASLTGFDQAKTSSRTVNEYSYYSIPCQHQPSSVPAANLDWVVGSGDNFHAFPMSPEDKRRIVIDADGALHFLYVKASDNSNNPYRCQLFNYIVSIKAVSLEIFNLNVLPVPEVMSKPILRYSKSVEGTIGLKVKLLCIFSGNPIPDVEWLKDGVKVADGTPRYKIDPEDSTGRKLIISKLEVKDEGRYICSARNSLGINLGSVELKVTGSPQWTKGPLKSMRIPVGATAKFQCDTVSYHATSSLPLWMKNGEPLIGCGVKKFWCGAGTGCYDYDKKCDGKNDCPGISNPDEYNCPGCWTNTDFMCADLQKCIPASERCNKNTNCDDGSDERNCAYDQEKVIDNKFHFSADLGQLTIPNVKKNDTMCLQCLVHNFREYDSNPKPDVVGMTFGDACLTVLDPISILSKLPGKIKVQRGDVVNVTISAQTDPLEQGNLRYDWSIGGKKYPELFPLSKWAQIIQLSMDKTHININTIKIQDQDAELFHELMGNLSVKVYHEFDQKTISTELFTEVPTSVPVIVPHKSLQV